MTRIPAQTVHLASIAFALISEFLCVLWVTLPSLIWVDMKSGSNFIELIKLLKILQ